MLFSLYYKNLKCILFGLLILLFSIPSYAWSNYFRFVNNFNIPLVISIPSVSYWMHDVIDTLESKDLNVLVNYRKQDGQWTPNASYTKDNHPVILKGYALALRKL